MSKHQELQNTGGAMNQKKDYELEYEARLAEYTKECREYFKNNPPPPDTNRRRTNRERLAYQGQIFGFTHKGDVDLHVKTPEDKGE